MGLTVVVILFESGKHVHQVLGIVEELMDFINDEFFNKFGRDRFCGAGLFIFGGGAVIAAIVPAVGLRRVHAVHHTATTGTLKNA